MSEPQKEIISGKEAEVIAATAADAEALSKEDTVVDEKYGECVTRIQHYGSVTV
jgi:hypothetical protein